MGNHADPENIVALANRPLGNGELSDDAIRHLIDSFYAKVRADPELGPIFHRAIPNDWGPHLATMRDFWSAVMLTSGRYKGNPVAVHLRVEGIEPRLFARWLQLFNETCRELFDDDVADVFRVKAARIAESLKLALFYRPDRPWQRARHDLRRHRQLHQVQVHGLHGGVSGRLLLRRRNMLVIHPDECIDCGGRFGPTSRQARPSRRCKRVRRRSNKLERFFSPNPGQGDAMNDDDRRSTTAQLVNAEHSSQGQEP